MRISHRYRFIAFSYPKAGSSSLLLFLDPYSDERLARNFASRTPENPFYPHMRPEEARERFEAFGWDFDGYTKLVVTRNPWARLVSLYEHVRRSTPDLPPFARWIYETRPFGPGGGGPDSQRWRRYGAYSIEHFIKDASGGILVDRVLRLEDLDLGLFPYLRAIGLPVSDRPIPRRNRRAMARQYQDYYTPETANYVADVYRYDIVNFGYRFNDRGTGEDP